MLWIRRLLQIVFGLMVCMIIFLLIQSPNPDYRLHLPVLITFIIIFMILGPLWPSSQSAEGTKRTSFTADLLNKKIYITIALLLLGMYFIHLGLGFLVGSEALPNGSGSCKAICSLTVFATQAYGETAGRLVASSAWNIMGLFSFYFAYKAQNAKAT